MKASETRLLKPTSPLEKDTDHAGFMFPMDDACWILWIFFYKSNTRNLKKENVVGGKKIKKTPKPPSFAQNLYNLKEKDFFQIFIMKPCFFPIY